MWGELSPESGASCLLNGASCLLSVGRVVLGRVFIGASCLGASCLWGELSVIRLPLATYCKVRHTRSDVRCTETFLKKTMLKV